MSLNQHNHSWIPKVFGALIVIGAMARYTFVQFNNPLEYLFSDPKRHWDNALHFFKPSLMSGCDPIVYQAYLLLVQTITGQNHAAVGVVTGALSAAMPWIFYRSGREFGLTKTAGLLLWALVTWTPSLFVIYRYFMIETVLLPLIGLGLWMTGRAMRKRDAISFLVMVFFWTLACLTKAQAMPIALICFGYAAKKLERQHRVAALCASVLLVTVTIAPNTYRSWTILGYPAPLGSGYIAQIMHAAGTKHTRFSWNGGTWIYSSPSCYIRPLEPLSNLMVERGYDDKIHDVVIDKKLGSKDWTDALKNAAASQRDWPHGLSENIFLFLFAPSWPDSGKDTLAGLLNYWFRWFWAPVLFLTLTTNIRSLLRGQFFLIPVLGTIMILLFMLQNSVTMEGRYRKPLEPVVLLNLVWLWPAAQSTRTPISSSTFPSIFRVRWGRNTLSEGEKECNG